MFSLNFTFLCFPCCFYKLALSPCQEFKYSHSNFSFRHMHEYDHCTVQREIKKETSFEMLLITYLLNGSAVLQIVNTTAQTCFVSGNETSELCILYKGVWQHVTCSTLVTEVPEALERLQDSLKSINQFLERITDTWVAICWVDEEMGPVTKTIYIFWSNKLRGRVFGECVGERQESCVEISLCCLSMVYFVMLCNGRVGAQEVKEK